MSLNILPGSDDSSYVATQAFATIALILLIGAVVAVTLYMCVHQISKNITIITLFSVCIGACKFRNYLCICIIYHSMFSSLQPCACSSRS